MQAFKVLTHVVIPLSEVAEGLKDVTVESVIEYKEDNMVHHTITDIRGLYCNDPKCFEHILDKDVKQ